MNLIELAKRCEAATADQQHTLLDDAYHAVFPKPERIWVTDNAGSWTDEYSAHHERSWRFQEFLDAKAYVDAALTLVPEGWRWTWDGARKEAICVKNGAMPTSRDGKFSLGNSDAPALAICAAALRAREAAEVGAAA